MRLINLIAIHCSFTKPRDPRQHPTIGAKTIRRWHTDPKSEGGRGWRDIGYHYVIKRDGTLELGRPVEQQGAHIRGKNTNSIGICLVGGMHKSTGKAVNDYTDKQWATLELIVRGLDQKYPGCGVYGHNDFTKSKTCPNFDVKDWWRNLQRRD